MGGGGVEGSNKPQNIVMQVVYMGIMQPTHTIAGSENESFYFVMSVKIEYHQYSIPQGTLPTLYCERCRKRTWARFTIDHLATLIII